MSNKFIVYGENGEEWEVEAPQGATEQDAINYVMQSAQLKKQNLLKPKQSGLGRFRDIAVAELAPYAAGVLAGGAAGSVIPGVGTAAGALAGAGAVGAAQLATSIGGLPTPADVSYKALGYEMPQDSSERVFSALAGGAGGALGLASGAKFIADTSSRGTLKKYVADLLADAPKTQAIAGGTGAASAQIAAENDIGPVGQTLAGLAGATLPTALGASRVLPKQADRIMQKADSYTAFKEAGISPTVADIVSTPTAASAQQFLKMVPLVGKPLVDADQRIFDEVKRSLDNLGASKAVTDQKASELLLTGAKSFKKKCKR